MIKQIHLRGISRTPSDHASEDGGCSESLNVQIDVNEIAPSVLPRDITEAEFGEGIQSIPGRIVYIHKTSAYTNYVVYDRGSLKAYIDGQPQTLIEDLGSSSVKDVTHIGNTLVVTTDDEIYYAVYKEGQYKLLSGGVPMPFIEFRTKNNIPSLLDYNASVEIRLPEQGEFDPINDLYRFRSSRWNTVLNKAEAEWTTQDWNDMSHIREIQQKIWDAITREVNININNGLFTYPVVARYAVRLYDGTYINVSAPVYLGAGSKRTNMFDGEFFLAEGVYTSGNTSKVVIHFESVFQAVAQIKDWDPGDWWDVIESVDLFLSPYIPFPHLDTKIIRLDASGGSSGYGGYIRFEGQSNKYAEHRENILNNVLSASNFYKIASFTRETISELSAAAGYDLLTDTEMGHQDYLLTQDHLDADCDVRYVPEKVVNYNARVIGANGFTQLPTGYGFFFAPCAGPNEAAARDVIFIKIKYHIRDGDTGQVFTVLGRASDGTLMIPEYSFSYSGVTYYSRPYGFIFCPHPGCFKVELTSVSGGSVTIPMKPHPSLNCSYGFLGLGTVVKSAGSGTPVDDSEDKTIPSVGTLILSEYKNPFVFGVGNQVQFNSRVVDLAAITRALSPSQLGQHNLYVFTLEGIFYITIRSDGSFGTTPPPLSMDRAIPGTVCPIDQAVVFVTESSVKLLMESDIIDLSPFMNGEHYVIADEVSDMLQEDTNYSDLVSSLTSGETFMEFMKQARCIYDYTGKRLVFFADRLPYQYVYVFTSKSWHKMSCDMARGKIFDVISAAKVGSMTESQTFKMIISSIQQGYENYVVNTLVEQEIYANEDAAERAINHLPCGFLVDSYGEMSTLMTLLDSACTITANPVVKYNSVLLDYETLLDQSALIPSESNPIPSLPGVIITRALSFDADDVRKTITQLRIRGRFNRGDVQYLLLVSLDGISWQVLRTLRGGSYKFFRIVVLTNLSPTERISWIEADVEGRFANKLR